jgi:transporter family-2 protein
LKPVVALPVVVAVGGLLAVQSRINSQLGSDLGQPWLASIISNGLGITITLTICLSRPRTWQRLRQVSSLGLPWWRYSGGAFGAMFVVGATLVVPHIGVALFTIGTVAGQTAGGLAVDRFGLGPGHRRQVTALRLTGGALAIVAVVIAQSGGAKSVSIPLIVAAAAIGLGGALQQAFNGTVQQQVGDAWVATAVNGIVGTIVLLVGYGLVAVFGHPGPHEWPGQWWLYLGGTIGVVVIFATVLAVRVLGVFRLVLALIAGQLAAAVVIDVVIPAQHGVVTPTVVAGVLLTFVAVSIAGRVPRARPAELPGTLEP